ncbi:putative damage-inducible protein DinB [Cytobacillus horneckiae]|uniref:DinB family protein n=1 Tax=Cytobacillus horneckiae TaxID=549687 RepID=A0A2N0ZAB0_9BACI|nr:DinB family protein [Cytobacillus horneckiae]MBN6886376.1 DinB family protein [Cytobacillus horneckiae]MEC1158544.1 DinB family protein [Cytobacillus horneckiae]MED2939647.1 DinB family protein [Cytobacillus horneckiae]PKG26443.1 DinB family protein [Cytobacillus horneckiae]
MSDKEILLAQLDACHNTNTWFVSLLNSIDGLTEEQAMWKQSESTNSIFEIINHLIYYNSRYLNRFKGIPNIESGVQNTFTNTDLNWADAVKRIDNIMSEWKHAVKKSDNHTLNRWALDLAHLTTHTAYHTGQILQLRKLQDSWNPRDGVKG